MAPPLPHRTLSDFAALSAPDTEALLACARQLQRAGSAPPALRGRNLGLLCDADDDADAARFEQAAAALGAQVAHVRASLSERSTPQEVLHMARLLGRLYDAVDCVGLAPDLVRRIGAEAGVPVFECIGAARHPTAPLAAQLEGEAPDADKRRLMIQAVLLSALG